MASPQEAFERSQVSRRRPSTKGSDAIKPSPEQKALLQQIESEIEGRYTPDGQLDVGQVGGDMFNAALLAATAHPVARGVTALGRGLVAGGKKVSPRLQQMLRATFTRPTGKPPAVPGAGGRMRPSTVMDRFPFGRIAEGGRVFSPIRAAGTVGGGLALADALLGDEEAQAELDELAQIQQEEEARALAEEEERQQEEEEELTRQELLDQQAEETEFFPLRRTDVQEPARTGDVQEQRQDQRTTFRRTVDAIMEGMERGLIAHGGPGAEGLAALRQERIARQQAQQQNDLREMELRMRALQAEQQRQQFRLQEAGKMARDLDVPVNAILQEFETGETPAGLEQIREQARNQLTPIERLLQEQIMNSIMQGGVGGPTEEDRIIQQSRQLP